MKSKGPEKGKIKKTSPKPTSTGGLGHNQPAAPPQDFAAMAAALAHLSKLFPAMSEKAADNKKLPVLSRNGGALPGGSHRIQQTT